MRSPKAISVQKTISPCQGETLQRIKMLFLITELNIGGAEMVVLETAARLNKDKFSASVCSLLPDGQLTEALREQGIKTFSLNVREKFDLRGLFRLVRLLRRERIDILHTHLFHANQLGRIAGRIAGVPVIISHQHGVERNRSKVRSLLDRLTSRYADVVISTCEVVKETLIKRDKISPGKIRIVYNGVAIPNVNVESSSVRRDLGIALDAPVIGVVANLRPMKGYDTFLKAARMILDEVENARFLIVGGGPLEDKLKAFASKLGIWPQTIFTGFRDDVPNLLATMDVFVLPSLWEGVPMALLEAMAMAKPVVATEVGGIPEIVIDGVTGLLVPPRDPDALAEAIIALLQDRERAEAMGRTGQERVERYFTVERMVQKTEALYEELIGEKMEGGGRRRERGRAGKPSSRRWSKLHRLNGWKGGDAQGQNIGLWP